MSTKITVKTTIDAPIQKVWNFWGSPEHITKWNHASDDWHTPRAENDLRTGGKFSSRMEAKDGSFGFDFAGEYDEVRDLELISYKMADERTVRIEFSENNGQTTIVETFDAESENPIELQRDGWQAIIDNFKRYTESH